MSKRRHGSYQDPVVAESEYKEVDEQQEDLEDEEVDTEVEDEDIEDEPEEERPRKKRKPKKEKEPILTPRGKRIIFGGLAILGLAGTGFVSYKFGEKKGTKKGDSSGYQRGYDEGQSVGRNQVYAALESAKVQEEPEETVADTVPFEE